MSVPVNLEIFMTDLTRAGLSSVSKNVGDAEGQARQLIAALEEVRAGYQRILEANRRAGQSYAQEEANVQALTGQINGLKEGLKELEAAKQQVGATPMVDADAVSRKMGNLRMQFQQVARELPSLAMGPQMFILAISNNLPMLADAIADVRKQNELLKASGQKSVPVWKQLGGALLSWQTALVAGISLLIVYGDEIIGWVKNLFNGEKQVDALAERMKALNDIQREAGLSAAKERSELDTLYKVTQDHTRSLEERNAAADELQRRYPKYFENLSNEAILAGNASAAYRQLTDDILKAAQARAAQDKITKNYERIFQLQRAINADTNWTNRNRERTKGGTATRPLDVVSNMGSLAVQPLTDDAIEYNRRMEALRKNQAELARLAKDNEYYAGLIDMESLSKADTEPGQTSASRLKGYLDEILQLRRDNEDRQIDLMAEGTEKELAEIDLRYRRIRDKVRELEAGLLKEQGGKLAPEQQALFAEAYNQIDAQQARDRAGIAVDDGTAERLEAEREAMNRYLKDYGTFEQRRRAITEEYNRKIAEATTEGDKLYLQKQLEEALSSLNLEKLKESINWELIFSDLGNASRESLDKVKQQLKAFKESDEYRGMAVDQKKVVDEALDNIQSALIDNGGLLGDLPNQLDQLRIAQDELTKAQEEYNAALEKGTDEQKEAAQKKLNAAQNNLVNQQNNVNQSTDKVVQNFRTLSDVLAQLGSSSEISLSQVGSLAEGIVSIFSETGNKVGGIVGTALSLLDAVGEQGLSGFVGNVFGSVGSALSGVAGTLLGWTSIDFGGESDPHLEDDIERLITSNQELEKAIGNLSDKMDDAAVADASSLYEVQKQNLEQMIKNTQEMMLRSADAYSNGFLGIGGSKSSEAKINKGMSAADWQAISDVVGRDITGALDFFRLSSEEMWRVANEATTEYAKLKELADDGYKDAAQFMDEYIGYWEQMQQLQDEYNEKLTSVSFDTVKSDFRNAMLEMEDSTEAFAGNFEKMMRQAILESMMTGTYDKALKDWYESFSETMKDGALDPDEQEALRRQWQDIVDSASKEWQQWQDLMDWDTDGTANSATSQSPQGGALTTMTQDSISTFEGIGRSLQTHVISLDKVTQELRDQGRADSESLMQIVNNTSYLLLIYELMERMDRDGIKIQ